MIQSYLDAAAERWADRTAIVSGEARISYGDLATRAASLARGLVEEGVRPGDRVAIYLDNRIETVVAIFAALKARAAFMMVNPTTKEAKFRYLLSNSGARAVIADGRAAAALAPMFRELDALRRVVCITSPGGPLPAGEQCVSWDELLQAPPEPRRGGIDLDLAALLYTSGSSGEPKGVMLTHLNVRTAIESVSEYLRLTSDDVVFNVLPLSFGYGLTQLLPAVRTGARLVLEKGFVFPHVTVSKMAAEGATGFAMVPTIASVLLNMDLSRYDLSALRYVTNAGAGLPSELAARFRRALPRTRLYLMYGQTECLRVSYLEPEQVDVRPDSVGQGMPNQELSIVDESGQPVAPDTIGELVVRGAHVMAGYWNMPEETERKLRPGAVPGERVLFTGDLFRQDGEGYFYFVARRDDIIKSRGEKVSPREVENAIYALPGVLEAAVVGVPDRILGEAVKAVVVLKDRVQLEARDIQRHCAARLEDFMVPSVVEFRQELPKNERGKIVKRELVTAATATGDRDR